MIALEYNAKEEVECFIVRFDKDSVGQQQREKYPKYSEKYRADNGTPIFRESMDAFGKTKAGNQAIRAFQASGESTSGKANGFWKIFLTDKIKRIEPTDLKWYKPVNKIKGGENIPPYVGPTKDSSFMNGLEKGVENKS